ncbi:hypothetical protein ACS126_09735 [Sphingobacterium lactis]
MARSHLGRTLHASRMHLRQGPDKLTAVSVPSIDIGYGNSGRTQIAECIWRERGGLTDSIIEWIICDGNGRLE